MLICKSKSARFLSSLNSVLINYDDWINLVNFDGHDPSSACTVQTSCVFKEDSYGDCDMDSKKVFSKTDPNCRCDTGGPSGVTCDMHVPKQSVRRGDGNQESIDNVREQFRGLPEKKTKSRQDVNASKTVPAHMSGPNVVASTSSYGGAFLQTVSTNFHCPSVHQHLLFGGYLRQNVFIPLNHYPAATAFQRSFSESSVTDQPNSNVRYRSSSDIKTKGKSSSSRVLSTARTCSVAAMRQWDLTQFGKLQERLNGAGEPGTVFTIVSYNVLAQDLLAEHPELYQENDRNTLLWEIRWKNLYQEFKEQNGDILCLQEVQKSHIDKYYNKLDSLGYNMLYKQRTGIRTDGCAIYYKTDKFALIEYTTVEYRQPNVSILDRDNVAIVATFAPKNNLSAQFVVATTHLLYNPRRQDVRLAQTQVLMAEIERFAYRRNIQGREVYIPIIVTGDFNSVPSSEIYNFIVNGRCEYEHSMLRMKYKAGKVLIPQFLYITDNSQHAELVEKREQNIKISRQEEEQMIRLSNSDQKNNNVRRHTNYQKHTFSSGTLSHNFNLNSVYKHRVNNSVEGTTYQDEWITVDYIFYSGARRNNSKFKETNLKLISKYTLPTVNKLKDVRIPNFELGSDHLSLIAKFKLEYH